MRTGACIFAVINLLLCVAWASPNLGIRPDFRDATGATTDRDIQSYSGIIKFDDGTIPLDKSKMTDAKLLHLARVAYNQMVDIWRTRNLVQDALPGAMAAFAYQDKLYFGSAIRAPAALVQLAKVPKGSVREMMDDALTNGGMIHAHGGGCAEINVIELVWDHNGQKDPEKEPPAPRVAIWVRPRNGAVGSSEINALPCSWVARSGIGYGCADIIKEYGVDPIDRNAAPDSAGENDWKFSLETNPRPPCKRP